MRGTYLACNDGEQLEGTYECDTDDYNTIGLFELPADATGDNVVDVNDVLYVISVWGSSDPAGDLDDDGTVAVNDVLMLLDAYGEECRTTPMAILHTHMATTTITTTTTG